jgi:hypothetical protein
MKVSLSVFVDFSPHFGRYVDYTLSSTWMEGDDGLSRWNMNCRRYVGDFFESRIDILYSSFLSFFVVCFTMVEEMNGGATG